MGAGQNGTMCCGNAGGLPCCAKDGEGKNCGDIVRARPMTYPGLEGLDEAGLKPGRETAGLSGSGAPSGSRSVAGGGPPVAVCGQPSPEGEEVYEDGSSYVGQLLSGVRHGNGVWTSPAEQYAGQWKNDQRDGQGRQTWQDGRVYEGQFKSGKFHGFGHMEWHMPNGMMVYDGQYVDDLKDGTGKYIWPDNRSYEGQWKRGHRSGQATYTNSQGHKREGIWKDDKVERWLDEE
uniref:MORN repeat-containing protein 5 n=1 Tax=Pyrodinium bahamense TaxID=73915 RepID=A0A7S0B9Y0_9DINO